VSRTLKTLADAGFVIRDPDTLRYSLGWRVFTLAASAGNQRLLALTVHVLRHLRDAQDLADLLRMGRLPEARIAPPPTRELRELVRHRAKLVALRSCCRAQVHSVLAKCGLAVPMSDLFAAAESSPAGPG
jgi:hypothetical protein